MRASSRPAASGRFVLRIDPALHAALRESARRSGLSLNASCARRLALPPGSLADLPAAGASLDRAAALFGERLVGLAVYGSWARGEAAASSDVDLLVVVDAAVRITRDLYRRWDESPVRWDAHPVEPHLVHLPPEDEPSSGLWAEVAVDGLLLLDRGLQLSRWLARVRREIFSGRIVRRHVHGQPYWAEAS